MQHSQSAVGCRVFTFLFGHIILRKRFQFCKTLAFPDGFQSFIGFCCCLQFFLAFIDNIIKQLGSAEEIDEEASERHAETEDQYGNPRIPRRLYRDLDNGKLGGVCAGIASYFDIDPAWVRLAAFLPLGLKEDAAFWADPDAPWTMKRMWAGEDMPCEHAL